eukprot:gene5462-8318_t
MAAEKTKRYRKKASDLGLRRVGPGGEEEQPEDEEEAGAPPAKRQRAGAEDAAKAKEPKGAAGGEDAEARVVEKEANAFAAVAKVLDEKAEAGFLGGYSLKEQKREEKAQRKLEKKRHKRKRAFEVDGGQGYVSESSESEMSEDEAAKRRKQKDHQTLRQHIFGQAHKRDLPSQRPDYEKRLRHVATKGVVRLFNAVAAAQKDKPEPEAAAPREAQSGTGEQLSKAAGTGPTKEELTRSRFLEMLKKGSESKRVK